MNNMIDRQEAINAIVEALDSIDHVPQWVYEKLTKKLEELPSKTEEKTVTDGLKF